MYLSIFALMLTDYIFTYLGINVFGCIEEYNFLMQGFMKLSFSSGLCIRILQGSIVLCLYYILKDKKYNKYKILIKFVFIIEIMVNISHLIWMYVYFL